MSSSSSKYLKNSRIEDPLLSCHEGRSDDTDRRKTSTNNTFLESSTSFNMNECGSYGNLGTPLRTMSSDSCNEVFKPCSRRSRRNQGKTNPISTESSTFIPLSSPEKKGTFSEKIKLKSNNIITASKLFTQADTIQNPHETFPSSIFVDNDHQEDTYSAPSDEELLDEFTFAERDDVEDVISTNKYVSLCHEEIDKGTCSSFREEVKNGRIPKICSTLNTTYVTPVPSDEKSNNIDYSHEKASSAHQSNEFRSDQSVSIEEGKGAQLNKTKSSGKKPEDQRNDNIIMPDITEKSFPCIDNSKNSSMKEPYKKEYNELDHPSNDNRKKRCKSSEETSMANLIDEDLANFSKKKVWHPESLSGNNFEDVGNKIESNKDSYHKYSSDTEVVKEKVTDRENGKNGKIEAETVNLDERIQELRKRMRMRMPTPDSPKERRQFRESAPSYPFDDLVPKDSSTPLKNSQNRPDTDTEKPVVDETAEGLDAEEREDRTLANSCKPDTHIFPSEEKEYNCDNDAEKLKDSISSVGYRAKRETGRNGESGTLDKRLEELRMRMQSQTLNSPKNENCNEEKRPIHSFENFSAGNSLSVNSNATDTKTNNVEQSLAGNCSITKILKNISTEATHKETVIEEDNNEHYNTEQKLNVDQVVSETEGHTFENEENKSRSSHTELDQRIEELRMRMQVSTSDERQHCEEDPSYTFEDAEENKSRSGNAELHQRIEELRIRIPVNTLDGNELCEEDPYHSLEEASGKSPSNHHDQSKYHTDIGSLSIDESQAHFHQDSHRTSTNSSGEHQCKEGASVSKIFNIGQGPENFEGNCTEQNTISKETPIYNSLEKDTHSQCEENKSNKGLEEYESLKSETSCSNSNIAQLEEASIKESMNASNYSYDEDTIHMAEQHHKHKVDGVGCNVAFQSPDRPESRRCHNQDSKRENGREIAQFVELDPLSVSHDDEVNVKSKKIYQMEGDEENHKSVPKYVVASHTIENKSVTERDNENNEDQSALNTPVSAGADDQTDPVAVKGTKINEFKKNVLPHTEEHSHTFTLEDINCNEKSSKTQVDDPTLTIHASVEIDLFRVGNKITVKPKGLNLSTKTANDIGRTDDEKENGGDPCEKSSVELDNEVSKVSRSENKTFGDVNFNSNDGISQLPGRIPYHSSHILEDSFCDKIGLHGNVKENISLSGGVTDEDSNEYHKVDQTAPMNGNEFKSVRELSTCHDQDVLLLSKGRVEVEAAVAAVAVASLLVDKEGSFESAAHSVSNILERGVSTIDNETEKHSIQLENPDLKSAIIVYPDEASSKSYESRSDNNVGSASAEFEGQNTESYIPVSFQLLQNIMRRFLANRKETFTNENNKTSSNERLTAPLFWSRCSILAATEILKTKMQCKTQLAQVAAEAVLLNCSVQDDEIWLDKANADLQDVAARVSLAVVLHPGGTRTIASAVSLSILTEGAKSLAFERIRRDVCKVKTSKESLNNTRVDGNNNDPSSNERDQNFSQIFDGGSDEHKSQNASSNNTQQRSSPSPRKREEDEVSEVKDVITMTSFGSTSDATTVKVGNIIPHFHTKNSYQESTLEVLGEKDDNQESFDDKSENEELSNSVMMSNSMQAQNLPKMTDRQSDTQSVEIENAHHKNVEEDRGETIHNEPKKRYDKAILVQDEEMNGNNLTECLKSEKNAESGMCDIQNTESISKEQKILVVEEELPGVCENGVTRVEVEANLEQNESSNQSKKQPVEERGAKLLRSIQERRELPEKNERKKTSVDTSDGETLAERIKRIQLRAASVNRNKKTVTDFRREVLNVGIQLDNKSSDARGMVVATPKLQPRSTAQMESTKDDESNIFDNISLISSMGDPNSSSSADSENIENQSNIVRPDQDNLVSPNTKHGEKTISESEATTETESTSTTENGSEIEAEVEEAGINNKTRELIRDKTFLIGIEVDEDGLEVTLEKDKIEDHNSSPKHSPKKEKCNSTLEVALESDKVPTPNSIPKHSPKILVSTSPEKLVSELPDQRSQSGANEVLHQVRGRSRTRRLTEENMELSHEEEMNKNSKSQLNLKKKKRNSFRKLTKIFSSKGKK